MDKDFALSAYYYWNVFVDFPTAQYRWRKEIYFLKDYLFPEMRILDIGEYNPLTFKICNEFKIDHIDNTYGDLDENFEIPREDYDFVINSHVIEHVFNPLHQLMRIRQVMKPDAVLFISTPIHPYFLGTSPGHFHEMDRYRFEKLIARAGFEIKVWDAFYPYDHWSWRSFTGLRPFVRSFYKTQALVICKKIIK